MSENERVVEDLEELAEREEMENYPVSVAKKSKKGFVPLIVAAIGIAVGGVALLKKRKKNRNEEIDDLEEDESEDYEDEDLEDTQTEEEVVEELYEDLNKNN